MGYRFIVCFAVPRFRALGLLGVKGLGFRVQGLGFRAATTTRVSLDPDFVAERVTLEAVVDHMTLP